MDYYRGCYIKQGDAPTNAQKMRHLNWFKELLPYWGNLIGWYKFNEGSGLIVHNYAMGGGLGGGLLPDLTVINNRGDFWTYLSGFGSSPTKNAPINYASISFPQKTWGGLSEGFHTQGVFIRSITTPKTLYGSQIFNIGAQNVAENINWNPAYGGEDYVKGANYISRNTGFTYGGGEWFFIFTDNLGRICRVRSDGTITRGTMVGDDSWNSSQNATTLFTLALNTTENGLQGSMGDLLFYNNITLTDAQWGQVYDLLRSRYGMAARSGW